MVEIAYGAGALGFWAKHAAEYLADEKIRSSNLFVAGRRLVVRYQPVGVVGVIGPWNYPLTNSFGDAIPALAAGNAVVLKPSEVTPLTSLLLAEGMRESGLPENVLQIAIGGGEIGSALVDAVDFVMFTGSTATGKKVMARAAETLTRRRARAGRQGPDDRARGRRPRARGQRRRRTTRCRTAARRASRSSACTSRRRSTTGSSTPSPSACKALRQGVPDGPASVEVGAMTFPPQIDIVSRHVEQAREAGRADHDRRPACARAPGGSTSRPCSPTSTTP